MTDKTAAEFKTQYQQDGFVAPLDIFNDRETSAIRGSFDALETEVGREDAQVTLIQKERQHEFIWKMATDHRILDLVSAVYGPDLVLIGTHFFCKYPAAQVGRDAFVAWHQDVTYWGLEPPKATTAWVAVDDVDTANGAMMIIPGTHRKGLLDHGKSDRQGNLLSINQAIPEDQFTPDTAVSIELKAGQMALHHGMVIHGSHPNHSDRRRCGLTIRYTTPDVRFVRSENLKAPFQPILVRGSDRFGYNQYNDPPTFNPGP
ncbi:MAG: phytanoyl-CoA dioxygenase family protein [Lentisphaeria bacterium]|jgi:ectoine hydroxylase-related dioxygenase (phytanoyl-CoA dioxygenase family)|nr:phytanoyl-CoA dioxygenase family protein [Lentisphaeria bacterium]